MTKRCPACGETFDVPYKYRRQRCCSRRCHGRWCAVRRPPRAFQRMGRLGGKLAAKSKRQARARLFLQLMGTAQGLGIALYCLGFQHGQNTARARLRREAA